MSKSKLIKSNKSFRFKIPEVLSKDLKKNDVIMVWMDKCHPFLAKVGKKSIVFKRKKKIKIRTYDVTIPAVYKKIIKLKQGDYHEFRFKKRN